MRTLEDLTVSLYSVRRKWIRDEQPPVYEVIERYPSLKIKKVVSYLTAQQNHTLFYIITILGVAC